MPSLLREHERRVLDGHLARARGEVVTGAGGPAAVILSRLSGWLMAGLYPVWAVVQRPFGPVLKPFADRPVALRVAAAACAVAVPASLTYMLIEEPEVELVRTGDRQLARVTAQTLNVRGGPGVDFPVEDRVYRDEQLPVVEAREGWVRVRLSDVDEAWISSRFVERGTEPVVEERPVPRHGWIFLVIACIGYLALLGVSRAVGPGESPGVSISGSAPEPGPSVPDPAPSRAGRSAVLAIGGGSAGGRADSIRSGSANGDAGAESLAELRAHLRAARTLLLEGTSSSRRDEFERLWRAFQRRLMEAVDVEDLS